MSASSSCDTEVDTEIQEIILTLQTSLIPGEIQASGSLRLHSDLKLTFVLLSRM